MIYIKTCYFICLTLVMLKGLYFLLTILQQEHYYLKPFSKCFFCYYLKKNYNYLFYILLLISLFDNVYMYIVGMVLGIIALLFKDKLLIKLKITKRIIRLFVTYSILLLLTFLLTFNLSYLSLIYLLNPFIVMLVTLINYPVEYLVKRYYTLVAKRKLRKLDSLVKVAITGSFGKTSTKDIIYSLLEKKYITLKTPASYNTIMGLTKVINSKLNTLTEVFVCEMGATHNKEIEEMTKLIMPKFRLITDVGYQHISTFKTLENVLNAKFELLKTEYEGSTIILNGDNQMIKDASLNFKDVIYYGINTNNTFNARSINTNINNTSFDIYHFDKYVLSIKTKLLGLHNVKNILASYALVKALKKVNIKISDKEFKEVIESIEPTIHRLNYKLVNNIHIYDDSYNANIVGFKNSVDVLKKINFKKIIITPGIVDTGEMTKKINEEVAEYIENVFEKIYIIDNESGKYIYDKLKHLDYVHLFSSFKEAYQDVVNNHKEEIALLIANDLPDNYLVRRKKNGK